jgi:hypothetical protein
MNRALVWALSPALPVFVLALQYWDLRRSPDLPDIWLVWLLLAISASATLFFGAFPKRLWWLAGPLAGVVVFGFLMFSMKLNVAWRVAGGVPEHWLLELSAVAAALAAPVALLVGAVSSLAAAKKWITRD